MALKGPKPTQTAQNQKATAPGKTLVQPPASASAGLMDYGKETGHVTKFDKRSGRLELAPGMIVQVNKDVLGNGYCINPISGFNGMDPFGGWRWKDIVTARQRAPQVALEWAARQPAPDTSGQYAYLLALAENKLKTVGEAEAWRGGGLY